MFNCASRCLGVWQSRCASSAHHVTVHEMHPHTNALAKRAKKSREHDRETNRDCELSARRTTGSECTGSKRMHEMHKCIFPAMRMTEETWDNYRLVNVSINNDWTAHQHTWNTNWLFEIKLNSNCFSFIIKYYPDVCDVHNNYIREFHTWSIFGTLK